MIKVQDWAEIRRLHLSEGMSARAIAKHMGVARDTVDSALKRATAPRYERAPVPSAFDAFQARVCELLRATPDMPATVIAERVGWSGSPSWFRKRVASLRPLFAPADPADRLIFTAGDQVQSDLWFPEVKFTIGRRQVGFPVLVMVCSHSRTISARMIPTRTTADLLAGTWWIVENSIGAVAHRFIWDNEAGIGRRNRLAEGVAAFMGTLGSRIVQLKAYDPESKGIVERANEYLETSFLPGRSFTDPDDFNGQLQSWLDAVANKRFVRVLGARPVELIAADRAAMMALPPVIPALGFRQRVRLGRDYYLRVLGNDYSIDPIGIGRMVEVRADLHVVTARLDGVLIASHPRAWGSALTITDPAHVESAARLRQAFQNPPPPDPADAGLVRDLADYDVAFGVDVSPEPIEWVA